MQPRLIENDDVLHEVFKFLDPSATEPPRCTEAQEHENRCRAALARSARASKVLSEHALNVLWRRIDGLLDIFSILPPFKRELPSAAEPGDDGDLAFHDGRPKGKGLWVRPIRAVTAHQTDSGLAEIHVCHRSGGLGTIPNIRPARACSLPGMDAGQDRSVRLLRDLSPEQWRAPLSRVDAVGHPDI